MIFLLEERTRVVKPHFWPVNLAKKRKFTNIEVSTRTSTSVEYYSSFVLKNEYKKKIQNLKYFSVIGATTITWHIKIVKL